MRHHKQGRKFHRITGRRKSFLRNLMCDLIRHGKIDTTEARAKSLRPMVERLVTFAKKGTLASRRLLIARLGQEKLVTKLIEDTAPRYAERKGGYLRIVKLAKPRKRDAGKMARIEFV
ncbi:MAG: 50S ribosomal protein L17 [Candidatus Liptonbacteria bacterium]|nr:50S ribosomal protein L17 [Candidatus Liptonbacteria bacterium]